MSRFLSLLLTCAAPAAWASASLTVTPLSHDQAAAFFTARGFTAPAIAPYAESCVLSFNFRNDGRAPLRFRLAEWRTDEGGRFRSLSDWEADWARNGVAPSARIAFRWAHFPPDQEFDPGDWIMGMAALERRINGPFRVIARYSDEKGEHEIVSAPVRCGD